MNVMQRFWSRLALQLGKHAGLVALVGLLVTLVLGFGVTRLEFATSQDSYLNEGDQVRIDNQQYQQAFGGDAMLVLVTAEPGKTIYDLASPENLRRIDAATQQLLDRPDLIETVLSPTSGMQWTNNLVVGPDGQLTTGVAAGATLNARERDPSPEGQRLRLEDTVTSVERFNAIPAERRNFDNPEWIKFLIQDNQGGIRKSLRPIFPDETHMQMPVRLVGNSTLEETGAGADLAREIAGSMQIEGGTVTVAGAPALLKDINDYLQGGMLQLGAIALVVMMVILLLLFDVRWRLLPLAVIAVGLVWAFGLAGYLGIPLSVVTIAGLPVMLGVGIDYAIQMHARVEEEVVIDRERHPIQETARNLCPALLVVTFDAVFAFAALRFAQVPMVRDFGYLLMVGIAAICLCSIVLPLASLGIREYKSPTKGKDFREGFLGRLTVKLGSLPVALAPVLAVASIGIFVGGLVVEEDLIIESDPIEWVDPGSETKQNIDRVQGETGSSSELGIFVTSDDIFSQETVDFVRTFAYDQLEQHPDELLTASSLVTTVSYVLDVPGASDVPPRAEDVRKAYEAAPEPIKKTFVDEDAGAMNLIFRYGAGSLDDRRVVLGEIREDTNPPVGVRAIPSGLAVVGVGLLENIESNRILLTYLSIAFVGLFLIVRLRSFTRSLLSLVPVLIAVGLASLVAYAFSLRLSPMTAVGGPLVTAVCTEFTSLILLRFIEERRRGLGPKAAADVAASRTGRAFIVSGLTCIAGVGVIATSSLPLLRDFGLIVAMNVAVALLSALVVLPPLLIWADRRGWVSKGMIPDDVLRASTPRYTGVEEEHHTLAELAAMQAASQSTPTGDGHGDDDRAATSGRR